MKMIEIRYSVKRATVNAMADISGSLNDFEILRQEILKFIDSGEEKISIDVNKNANSEGWDYVLKVLELNQKGESVEVSVMNNEILTIKGSKNNLEILTSWLEFDEDTSSGYHSHYEYFEGNEYINSESIPLIIRIK